MSICLFMWSDRSRQVLKVWLHSGHEQTNPGHVLVQSSVFGQITLVVVTHWTLFVITAKRCASVVSLHNVLPQLISCEECFVAFTDIAFERSDVLMSVRVLNQCLSRLTHDIACGPTALVLVDSFDAVTSFVLMHFLPGIEPLVASFDIARVFAFVLMGRQMTVHRLACLEGRLTSWPLALEWSQVWVNCSHVFVQVVLRCEPLFASNFLTDQVFNNSDFVSIFSTL